MTGFGIDPSRFACPATPEQEEGPYYRHQMMERSAISEGRTGVPLALQIEVTDTDCRALTDVPVDIWHCDALGIYSWYAAEGEQEDHDTFEPAPGNPAHGCEGAGLAPGTFLRGWQRSGKDGRCRFQTIYPGWYPGRSVHIHVKVYHGDGVLTSQLYFPEQVTDAVHRLEPYRRRPSRDTRNANDVIFWDEGGEATMITPVVDGDGYTAPVSIAVS